MKNERAAASSDAPEIARVLLRRDLFSAFRSDEQLDALVAGAVRAVARPYSMLLCRLLGYYPRLPEQESSRVWERIVKHRAELTLKLERPVHLRVAALDLLALGGLPPDLGTPILLGPRVVRGLLELDEL